jgi:hypothetical protein
MSCLTVATSSFSVDREMSFDRRHLAIGLSPCTQFRSWDLDPPIILRPGFRTDHNDQPNFFTHLYRSEFTCAELEP